MCEAVLKTQCDKYRQTPLGRSRCYKCVEKEGEAAGCTKKEETAYQKNICDKYNVT